MTTESTISHRATEPMIYTVKEMAAAIQHSEDYVGDMKKGGFRLPATRTEAVEFIRLHGPPRRFRQQERRTRNQLYGHRPSCERQGAAANEKNPPRK